MVLLYLSAEKKSHISPGQDDFLPRRTIWCACPLFDDHFVPGEPDKKHDENRNDQKRDDYPEAVVAAHLKAVKLKGQFVELLIVQVRKPALYLIVSKAEIRNPLPHHLEFQHIFCTAARSSALSVRARASTSDGAKAASTLGVIPMTNVAQMRYAATYFMPGILTSLTSFFEACVRTLVQYISLPRAVNRGTRSCHAEKADAGK